MPEIYKWTNRPINIMLILILLIIVIESLIMYLLSFVNGMVPPVALIFIDSLLLVCILCPALYSLVVSPLLAQIFERTAAESALSSSKAQYRQLIDSVECIVWEVDPHTFAFRFVSHRAEDILGFPVQRWLDEPTFWADHLHPDDREWAIEFCVAATREKRDHIFEYRMIAADGRIVWLRDLVTVVIEGGEVNSLRGLMVDVTERKNTEIALATSEKRHKFLADNLYDVIWEMDGNLCYVYISGSVEKSFGYKSDELLGQPFGAVMTEQSLSKALDVVAEFRAGNNQGAFAQVKVNHEFEFIRKDGSTFWGDVSATLIFSPSQELNAIIGSTRDITDRKLAEAELKSAQILHEEELNRAYNMVAERNAFVESVITSIQSGIIVLDPELRIRMINPYAAGICRLDADELVDLHLGDICPELPELINQNGDSDEIIATFSGNRLIIGYSFFHIKNARGSITGTIVTFKDLTEIVRIRNEIRQKQRLSAMGEVVARVAHEMRNPLFGMTSAGQILNMELDLNSAQQVLMDSFLKESRRLNNLVDELLDSTREVRLSKKMMNLIDVVNDSLRLVKVDAAETGVIVPPAEITGEIIVHGDPEKMEQVLLNLLRNGIEACDYGGRVDLAVKVEGVMALVEVVDTGSGIPEDIMESIFDVFYTTKKNGTGMGLSISKNIVEAHDGELMVFNNQVGGATFVVKLPLLVMTDESANN